ncbi:MAG: hypothetical protein ACW98F_04010 [Candidatus Hodarchaeales archaeon]|jgi:hypothetical protein
MITKKRPVLLSLIALLEILAGVLIMLTGGLFVVISFGLLGDNFDTLWEETFADVFGAVFGILAGVVAFVGFLIFLLGYGLWRLNYAAWFVSTFLYGLGFINILLTYEIYLTFIQASLYSNLLTPLITIGIFLYFLTIRDRFS